MEPGSPLRFRAAFEVLPDIELGSYDDIKFDKPDVSVSDEDVEADLKALQEDLSRLYDLGDFERIGYRLVRSPGGTDLVIHTEEKPWGPDYLRFGLNFVNDLEGDSDYSVLARYTRTRMNPLGAEWRNDVRIGRTRLLASELFQPLDFSGRWFVAPGFQYSVRRFDDFLGH